MEVTSFFSEEGITAFFTQYAYSPMTVYIGVILFMTASSFGLPIPEEVVLVSCGFIAYMAANPDLFPSPTPGAESVDLYTLATICTIAVILSDLLIYYLGKFFGAKIMGTKFFQKQIGPEKVSKVEAWYKKYGALVCGLFRFTPGVRFPGHMSCGMMGVPVYKFLLVDGTAALLSVPTQVLLVAAYGKVILDKFKEFKLILISLIVLVLLVHFARKKWLAKAN